MMGKKQWSDSMKLLVRLYEHYEENHKQLMKELHSVFIELKKLNTEERAKTIEEMKQRFEQQRSDRDKRG